jgi:hypothetical protein
MAAITIVVAMQPPSHEYHLIQSFVSARLFFLNKVETDTPVSVVSLMVVSTDNPPTCQHPYCWHLRAGPQLRAMLLTALFAKLVPRHWSGRDLGLGVRRQDRSCQLHDRRRGGGDRAGRPVAIRRVAPSRQCQVHPLAQPGRSDDRRARPTDRLRPKMPAIRMLAGRGVVCGDNHE